MIHTGVPDAAPRPAIGVCALALAYAAIPALGGTLWLLLGDSDPLRNRSPVDLLPFFELVVVLLAIRAGLRGDALRGKIGRAQAVAVAVLLAVVVWTTATAALDPIMAVERLGARLAPLAVAVSLGFLIGRVGPRAGQAFTLALVAQPLVHLPILATLYALHFGDLSHNWLGGPVGFWHVRIWGMAIAVALAAGFGLYAATAPGRWGHVGWAVILGTLATLLFFSASRAGMVGLAAAALTGAVIAPRRVLRRLPMLAVVLVLGAALSTWIDPPTRDYGLFNSLDETTSANLDRRTGGRLNIWSNTIEQIKDRPLFGHGHDQFRLHQNDRATVLLHPHSAPLTFVFDFGLIGGAALGFLLLTFWWRGVQAARGPDGAQRLGGLFAVNTLFAMSLFDGPLYHPEPLLMLAIGFAVLLAGSGSETPTSWLTDDARCEHAR